MEIHAISSKPVANMTLMSHDQVESVQAFVTRTLGILIFVKTPGTCLLFLSSLREANKDVDRCQRVALGAD